jgi:hypothetical protein
MILSSTARIIFDEAQFFAIIIVVCGSRMCCSERLYSVAWYREKIRESRHTLVDRRDRPQRRSVWVKHCFSLKACRRVDSVGGDNIDLTKIYIVGKLNINPRL